ncbi:hypothetical protein [Sulfurivirga sp.]|uniref:hypothetical protein n=1 Tax=Sulfurivirga sp. TaxID=2614236 RepID=UPI0025D50291|nr:hypothetical protein [Sulfurivirga sp.]
MNQNLLYFLLTVLVILLVAWLWPTRPADDEETLNSQDWRIQDFRTGESNEKHDEK